MPDGREVEVEDGQIRQHVGKLRGRHLVQVRRQVVRYLACQCVRACVRRVSLELRVTADSQWVVVWVNLDRWVRRAVPDVGHVPQPQQHQLAVFDGSRPGANKQSKNKTNNQLTNFLD